MVAFIVAAASRLAFQVLATGVVGSLMSMREGRQLDATMTDCWCDDDITDERELLWYDIADFGSEASSAQAIERSMMPLHVDNAAVTPTRCFAAPGLMRDGDMQDDSRAAMMRWRARYRVRRPIHWCWRFAADDWAKLLSADDYTHAGIASFAKMLHGRLPMIYRAYHLMKKDASW